MESINEEIVLVKNKLFPSNTYIIINPSDNTCCVIDPGLDYLKYINLIDQNGYKPIAIISTHGHFDHIGGVQELKVKYGAVFYLHDADLKMTQSANFFLHVAGIKQKIQTPKPDILFNGKHNNLEVGNFKFKIINYPGHSNGSCVLSYKNYLFTGDILYKKGLGPESIPREDKTKLKESIVEIFSNFDGELLVLPGHGHSAKLSTIKYENKELIEFLV